MKTIAKWFIAIGSVGVALSLMGFGSFIVMKSTNDVYYYVFDSLNYFKGVNANLDAMTGIFTGQDFNLNDHLNWSDAIKAIMSIANIIIWLINLFVLFPFKLAMAALSFVTSILGLTLKGSVLDWLYQLINGVAGLALPYIPFS